MVSQCGTVRCWSWALNPLWMVLVLIARYGWAKDGRQLTLTRHLRHKKRRTKIRKAFEVTELYHFTDDATVYEHQGWQVELISGNPENIKITSPEDMAYADFLIQRKNK